MELYGLEFLHKWYHPSSHFFDRESLKFFGERPHEMYVLKRTKIVPDYDGTNHQCYVLSTYQRNHPSGPRRHHYYFDMNTFDVITPPWDK